MTKKQTVQFTIEHGVNTKRDPLVLPPGEFVTLENGTFTQLGTFGKRAGYDALSSVLLTSDLTTSSLSQSVALAAFNEELVSFDGDRLSTYLPAFDRWSQRSSYTHVDPTTRVTAHGATNLIFPDHCVVNGVELSFWVQLDVNNQASATFYNAYDSTTRAKIVEDQALDFNTQGVVKGLKTDNHVAVISSQPGGMFVTSFPPEHPFPSFRNQSSITADQRVSAVFNVDACYTGNQLYVAYYSGSTGTANAYSNLRVACLTGTLQHPPGWTGQSWSIVWNVQPVPSESHGPCAIFGSGSSVYVASAYRNTTPSIFTHELRVSKLNPSNGAATTLKLFDNSGSELDLYLLNMLSIGGTVTPDTSCSLYYEIDKAPHHSSINRARFRQDMGGTPSNTRPWHLGLNLVGKPFVRSGSAYVLAAQSWQDQETAFLVRDDLTSSPLFVSKAAVIKFAGGNTAHRRAILSASRAPTGMLTEAIQVEADAWQHSIERQGPLLEFTVDEATSSYTARPVELTHAAVLKHSFNEPTRYGTAELESTLLTNGGMPSSYDSSAISELGFNSFPSFYVQPTLVATSSGPATGSYQYSFTYEHQDNAGNYHESRPSVPVRVYVTSASSAVKLSVVSLYATNKQSTRIVGYRTPELTSGSTVFYRFTDVLVPVTSSKQQNTQIIFDQLSDVALTSRPTLYSVSELQHETTPAAKHVTVYRNRLVLANTDDDPTAVWLSKQTDNVKPPAFSSLLRLRVSSDNREITAVATLDDKLIVFKERSIFFLASDGPNNTNTNGQTFGDLQRIASDVGCIDARSVVELPAQGLMFQARSGFHVLGRDLSVRYIGSPIEGLLRSLGGFDCSSACLVPNSREVRFTSVTGTTLVYDYSVDRWSTHTGQEVRDSVLWDDSHVLLMTASGSQTPASNLRKESETTWLDNGQSVSTRLTTGWINVAGIVGTQRVWRLWVIGRAKSPCTLNVGIAYDGVDDFVELKSVSSTAVLVDVAGQTMEGGVKLGRSTCKRVKFTVFDSECSGTGQGIDLSGIAISLGIVGDLELGRAKFAL